MTADRMVGSFGTGIRGRSVAGTRSGQRDVYRSVDKIYRRAWT